MKRSERRCFVNAIEKLKKNLRFGLGSSGAANCLTIQCGRMVENSGGRRESAVEILPRWFVITI